MQTKTGKVYSKDRFWMIVWAVTVSALAFWDLIFLNKPAFSRIINGTINTFSISLIVVVISLLLGWLTTLGTHFTVTKRKPLYVAISFTLNLIRSIPQIVGILFSYIGITALVDTGIISNNIALFFLMAFCMSIFIFPEIVDLMKERIEHFGKLDFYNAMRICGIAEMRIVNFNILWKNSRIHILNKLISVFGIAIFLQCSVDFIISVGLSTDVNSVTLPVTLGSLLAKIDSKQDILAIGYSLTHPGYVPQLFLAHLQGLTIAFMIVFSLYCIYNISNSYAERHRL
jgi:ABC-type dipeptide/oligopeptide/nickel transport system permease subunit